MSGNTSDFWLSETVAIYITVTSRNEESYQMFDINKFDESDNIEHISDDYDKHELSLDLDDRMERHCQDPINTTAANRSPQPVAETIPEISEFLSFLDLIDRLTKGIRNLTLNFAESKRRNDEFLEDNYMLKIKNYKLKIHTADLPLRASKSH